MSAEKTMRKRIVAILKPLHAVSIENGVGVGTPDVNYIHGWIELKSVEAWPVYPTTPLRIEHYTNEQRIWAVLRSRAGGLVLTLLKVGDDWILLDGETAAREGVGRSATKETILRNAIATWMGGLDEEDLLRRCRALRGKVI